MNIQAHEIAKIEASRHNLALDLFGQELSVGDYVLCQGYYSVPVNTITQIVKINKQSVVVSLEYWDWTIGEYTSRKMRRPGYKFIKITKEQANTILANNQATLNKYPEYAI